MPVVFLSLGANLGNPLQQLQQAIEKLSTTSLISELKLARFYKTSPIGPIVDQPTFVNTVVQFTTSQPILWVCDLCEKISSEITGSFLKEGKYGPRVIDLDILFYGNDSYHIRDYIIPHPRWRERLFVLEPLSDLTKRLKVPCHHTRGGLAHVKPRELADKLKLISQDVAEAIEI